MDLDEYKESTLLAELARRQKLREQGRCDYCANAVGVPIRKEQPDGTIYVGSDSCKMYARHRGEVE